MPLDDFAGRAAYYVGDLDRKLTGIMRRIVRPGDRVLDIGANLGIVTLPMAMAVGERGAVHAFEPNPVMQEHLERSLRRNGLNNVRLHPWRSAPWRASSS